jgi:N-acetylmuramoyl-L-alanine amidase
MIVLHRKRLILIGSLMCLSLTVFSLKSAFTKPQFVETVNLPVSNKVIVLDAGHGVPDERS